MFSGTARCTNGITAFDLERLGEILRRAKSTDYRGSKFLKNLRSELKRAEVVMPKEIPVDVVTMNLKVGLEDMDTQEEEVYTLVFPEDAEGQ